ncbi:hypothetical protein HYFRA_00010475 [Hymenoscyphus fraxineus]|uniref:Uncharacterized protein n=1 Tax=Hymenoscyphus fraxineus TaxID=746836 RepID=A0A9N9PWC1_9HELO|nr:hypothetical protein HYFRA_00010475 [Hymenoscyphus fraxineus]
MQEKGKLIAPYRSRGLLIGPEMLLHSGLAMCASNVKSNSCRCSCRNRIRNTIPMLIRDRQENLPVTTPRPPAPAPALLPLIFWVLGARHGHMGPGLESQDLMLGSTADILRGSLRGSSRSEWLQCDTIHQHWQVGRVEGRVEDALKPDRWGWCAMRCKRMREIHCNVASPGDFSPPHLDLGAICGGGLHLGRLASDP